MFVSCRRVPCCWIAAAILLAVAPGARVRPKPEPPKGFKLLFNGKDLSGWHGMPHFDPYKLAAMNDDERKTQIEKWTEDGAQSTGTVEKGELINDGNGAYLTTDEELGDIELRVEYKTVPKADSGIYLRLHAASADLGLHRGRRQMEARRRQGQRRPVEQQPRLSRQGPARPGRQAVRRVGTRSASSWSASASPSI